MENKQTIEDLKTMQSWSLERKIQVTQTRIIEWYQRYEGQVYVSFSGGKDSTVLLDLARRIYPNIKGVFADTGLEYPEIREFVKTKENIEWIRPKIPFNQVIEKYGFPIISKEISRDIGVAKNKPDGKTAEKFKRDSDYTKKYGDRWCLEKYAYLIDSPFKISNRCCDIMKKNPLKTFFKETGLRPIIATMASESALRKKDWLVNGCNAFENNNPISKPMSFWTEQDVFTYLKRFDIPYCSVYGEIIEDKKGKFKTTKLDRTGCMFCMYGVQSEKEPNRFQRMKITHPKQYDYCINKLGLGEILDYIGVKY